MTSIRSSFSTAAFKVLAVGARFVLAGRPFIYAAAVGGSRGVEHAIDLLHDEVDRSMTILGYNSTEEVSADCLG
jgi:L-lactate dehydrogenase (cytochrome)